MRRLSVCLVLFAAVAATGCSNAAPSGGAALAPILDGVYQAAPGGSFTWLGIHGDAYVLWSADAACNADYAKAPSTCATSGTYTLDVGAGTLALTDANTGHVEQVKIDIDSSQTRGDLYGQSSRGTGLSLQGAGLVGGSQQGLYGSTSDLIATQFAIYQPSGAAVSGQQVSLRTTTFALLSAICILYGNPAGTTMNQPDPPVPVATAGCSSGGRGSGSGGGTGN